MPPRKDHSNITDIVKQIRRFNQLELLAGISLLASQLDEEPARAKQLTINQRISGFTYPRHIVVSTHGLAALTRIVLANGNKWPHAAPTEDDVILLENHVSNLPSFFTTEPLGSVLPEQLFFQMAKQQFLFQTGADKYAFGRSIVLYKEIPILLASEGTSPALDLDGAFKKITGMSIVQYMWTGFLVWAAAKRGKAFSLPDLRVLTDEIGERWQGDKLDLPTLDAVSHFLDHVSLDVRGFADNMGDLRKQDERLLTVDYRPLLLYPVVRTGNGKFIVPIPKLLIDRFTDGLFHDFANGMRGPGVENPFREYFGELFERYVGLQLSLVFAPGLLHSEKSYGNVRAGKRTPDWVVNDSEYPLAIECRSSTFRLDTQRYADLERIAKDLERIGVETVSRILPKIQDIHESRTHISLASKGPMLPILCTFESLEPIGMFGAFIRNELRKSSDDEPPSFFLMPVHYLETMCATENREDFFRALMKLEVDLTWHDSTGEGPQNRWRRVMADPMPKNRILMDAVDELWSACSGFQSGS